MEVVNESLSALRSARGLLLVLVLAAAAALLVERALRPRLGARPRRWIFALVALAAAGVGLRFAWEQRFLCDDAFISFRYARNLAEGYGLVWNRGEWVEGYTNFLWTVALAGLHKLGADIPFTALVGCLASFVAALLLAAASVRKLAPKPPLLPFAAIALAGSLPFQTFATSGLETMPGAALVIGGLYASLRPRGTIHAGLLLVAAALTRPDHVLFYGCFGVAIVLEDLLCTRGGLWRRLDLRRYVTYAAPFFLIFLPYYLIRWRAYGDFYPNTYYAKSGDLAYWKQGFIYGLHFVGSSGAWAWLPVLLLALVGRVRNREETRVRLFAALAVPVFSAYVMKVGGDFMEYRFFVPVLPVAAVAAEVGLRWRFASPGKPWTRSVLAALTALAAGAPLLPIHLVGVRNIRWGISRENTFYPLRTAWPVTVDCPWEGLGRALRTQLTDQGVEPPIAGAAIGLLGYYSRLPVVDALGLTNRAIGHKPIPVRTRPGHEKVATIPELVAQGAVLDVGQPGDPYFRDMREVRLPGARLTFLRFDPVWAAMIGRLRGAQLPQPARDVERIVRTAPRERVLASLGFYGGFLSGHPLREPLLARLRERLAAVADFEEDAVPGAKTDNRSLRISHQGRPYGASGNGWLTSLPDTKGGVGRLEIPVGPLTAAELRMVLGGTTTEKVYVDLVIDGKAVRHAVPGAAPGLSPVVWNIADLSGKSGTLVIADENPARGKGIMVDAIHFAPTEGDIRARIAETKGNYGKEWGELLREARWLLPEDDPDRVKLESHIGLRFSLDTLPPGTVIKGEAFGRGPEGWILEGQEAIVGIEGTGYLNSGHGGDASKGRVELPEFDIPSEPIWVLVGGGRTCDKLYVGLEVGGKVVSRVCGQNDHWLRREPLSTGNYAGKRGRIVIVDDAEGWWAHILADEILIPK